MTNYAKIKPRGRVTQDGRIVPVGMYDSLTNLVAGLNVGRDKRSHNAFSAGSPIANWIEIEGAYMDNWIASQVVEVPVDDGLREWRSFSIEDATEIENEEKRLKLPYHYKLARYWARLYGGSIIVMITDQDLQKELDPRKIKKGGLYRLVVLDRWDVQPRGINYSNPLRDDYLLPEWYTVSGGSVSIHSSHVIRCDGKELPRRMRAMNQGWGDSALRKMFEDIKDATITKGGIASMILEANVDTISREGLSDELANDQEENILKRFALAGQMKSIVNMLLLDGAETYERKSLAFGGLAQIMNEFMVWISGACDIPATRLFGQSPKGMNATGDSDMQNYYNMVRGMQESVFTPDFKRIDEVLVRSAMGEYPAEFAFEWNPLFQESGTELAQQDLAQAQAEDARIAQGVLKPSQIAMRLMQEGKYAITEEQVNKMQKKEAEEEAFENDPDNLDPNFEEDPDEYDS